MSHPLVRAAINRRVTGDANLWPIGALRRRAPVALSIGSGTGAFERTLIGQRIADRVTGVDASAPILEIAQRDAAGLPIDYVAADARQFLREHPSSFDGIFFHEALHHFDRLDELLSLVAAALRPGGFLWYDEYIGPARDQWTIGTLLALNLAYRRLPRRMRRPHLVRAPINRDDPTEAIASSDIIPATERQMRIVERHDYGGNLLMFLYPNLRQPQEGGPPSDEFDRWIAKLIEWDERAMRRASSWSTVLLAEPVVRAVTT